jgi:RNA polymerase sigma-70 factor (ECF subfamily)
MGDAACRLWACALLHGIFFAKLPNGVGIGASVGVGGYGLAEGCGLMGVSGLVCALGSAGEAGEAVDLAALVEAYARVLYRVAYSVLRSEAEAEDAVQDAFVRVLQHRQALPAVRDMRVWLVRVVWNVAMDRRRRVKRARVTQMDAGFAERLVAGSVAADEALGAAREVELVLREMERLPKAERQVLLLSAVEELGTGEIALVMERSEAAVRGLLFRARERLRERLGTRLESRWDGRV